MPKVNRRKLLQAGVAFAVPAGLLPIVNGCRQDVQAGDEINSTQEKDKKPATEKTETKDTESKGASMQIQYLEIVTPEVDAICKQYSAIYEVTFGEPVANLGNARTAELEGGGLISVRAPMRDDEAPVVRPYMAVDKVEDAVAAAKEAGAEIAIEKMEIPDHGTIAIVILGGIECGFWQS